MENIGFYIECGSLLVKYICLKCTLELNQAQFWNLPWQAVMKKYTTFDVAAQEAEIKKKHKVDSVFWDTLYLQREYAD